MKSPLSVIFAAVSLLVLPATAQSPAQPAPLHEEEPGLSPAASATLEQTRRHFEMLAGMLNQIRDAGSAARLAPAVVAAHEELAGLDFSAFETEDEELLAMEAVDFVFRLSEQITRLEDADFYGNAQLKAHFGETGETEPATLHDAEPQEAPESPALEAGTESVLP